MAQERLVYINEREMVPESEAKGILPGPRICDWGCA